MTKILVYSNRHDFRGHECVSARLPVTHCCPVFVINFYFFWSIKISGIYGFSALKLVSENGPMLPFVPYNSTWDPCESYHASDLQNLASPAPFFPPFPTPVLFLFFFQKELVRNSVRSRWNQDRAEKSQPNY